MCTPHEKFFTPLTASEYRLLDILCTLSQDNVSSPTMEELSQYAQCSEESLRRALRKLESVSLIKVERTKRNLGKFSYNKYWLISPSHKNVGSVEAPPHKNVDLVKEPSHKNVGSTLGIDIAINNNIENKTTSYFMFEPEHKKTKKVVIVGRGWQDDDAELAGFGLFDDEIPSSKVTEKISKRSSKTRSLRPQEDWTALDVAAEFSSQVYQRLPGAVNVVNTLNLQKILSKNRKQFQLNAIIELEVMKLFFADPWFKSEARKTPHYIQGRFLKYFTSHLHTALKNLGLHSDLSMTEEDAFSNKLSEFVYASDGTSFDNSMPGRKDLEKYEEKMRRTNDEATL